MEGGGREKGGKRTGQGRDGTKREIKTQILALAKRLTFHVLGARRRNSSEIRIRSCVYPLSRSPDSKCRTK